MLSTEHRS